MAIAKEAKIEEASAETVHTCSHHWIIGDPEGPTSSGVCKHCGAKRDFMNYFEGSSWGSEISLDRISKKEGISKDSDYSSVAKSVKAEDAF